MQKIINFLKNNWDFLAFMAIIISILSPFIFKNGYFMDLDYISWPEINFIHWQYYPNYIIWMYVQKFFSFFLWNIITQKIFILWIFFIWYLSIKKLLWKFFDDKLLIFIWIVFFFLNPFVYPRLVQWQFYILYAYSLLPLVFYFLLDKKILYLSITCALIFSFSPHFVFILSVIFISYFIFFFKEIKNNIKIKDIIIWLSIIILFNLYWIINISNWTNILNFWNDFYYFSSKTIYFKNIYLEILSLNWFWWDAYKRYIIKISIYNYIFIASIILLSIFWFKKYYKNNKNYYNFLIFIFITSFILSIWVSENNLFKNFSLFLYENIPFYSWLREANKFSSLIVIVYIIFILKWLNYFGSKKIIILFLFLIILSPNSSALIFKNQINWYKYPKSWEELKIEIDKNYKNKIILSLPWHQSMSFSFVENKNIMNPIGLYFWNNILLWDNIEIWDLYSQSTRKESKILEKYFKNIWKNKINLSKFIKELKDYKIEIIMLNKESDYKVYKELLDDLEKNKYIKKSIQKHDIIIYNIL